MVKSLYTLLVCVLFFTSFEGAAQVTRNNPSNNACTDVPKNLSNITITETIGNDFDLPVGLSTIVFEAVNGTLVTEQGTASFSPSLGLVTTNVSSTTITISITPSGTEHLGTLEMLTLSGLRALNNSPGTMEIQYISSSFTIAGLSPNAVVATVQTVAPPVASLISGESTVCAFSTGKIYSVAGGFSNYQWSVGGGNIVAGVGTETVTVDWTSTEGYSLQVNYENASGCVTQTPAQLNVGIEYAPTANSSFPSTCSNVIANYNLLNNITNGATVTSFSWIAGDDPAVTGETHLTPASGQFLDDDIENVTTSNQNVIYTVTPTGTCGVGAPFTVTLVVGPEPHAPASTDITSCIGKSINFNLNTLLTNSGIPSPLYSWQADVNANVLGGYSHSSAGSGSLISDNPILNPGITTTTIVYHVTTTSQNFCDGDDFVVRVTLDVAPIAPPLFPDVCSGAPASIDLQQHINTSGNNIPSNFSWIAEDNPNVNGESLSPQNSSSINDILDNVGTSTEQVQYNVTASSLNANCPSLPFAVITDVNKTPQAAASLQTICGGVAQNFDINAHYTSEGNSVPVSAFSWLAADNANVNGETIPPQATTQISDVVTNSSGSSQNVVYTITAVSPDGCVGVFTRTVTVDPEPVTNITNSAPTISSTGSTNIALSSNVGGATFSYTVSAPPEISGASPGSVSPIAQSLTNSNTLQHIVTYTITATANGCVGSGFVASVTVRGDPTMNQNDSLALVALYNATGGASWTTQTNWISGPANTWQGVSVSSERLTSLALPANNLTGSLPVAFFNAPLLNLLDLRNNNISGALPAEISNLTGLQVLNLQNNQMDGTLPNNLFNLANLTQLYLRGNDFIGSLPSVVSNLTNLQTLQAEGLPMSGTIPSEVFGLTSLVNLGLSGKINGPLPASITALTSLQTFNCDSCAITSIPAGITSLANLTSIRLQNNKIESLPNLSSLPLTYLDVSKNSLTFESLEPHASIATFVYAPQDTVGIAKSVVMQTTIPHNFASGVGGSSNQYVWRKNNVVILSATSATYTITSPVFEDEGAYHSEVTNTLLPGLTIKTSPVNAKVSSLKRDSLTLLQIYNTTNGVAWTGVSGWPAGKLATWTGVIISSNRVTGLDLSGKGLTGTLPAEFTDLRSLQNANLSGNKLTGIPVVSSMTTLTNLNISSNNISFGTLEPNVSVLGKLTYSPQNVIGVVSRDSIPAGSPVELSAIAPGTNNLYQWKRNNTNVVSATSSTLVITAIGRQTMGDYICEITNSVIPNLVLRTAAKTVLATADLSGKINISSTNSATKGTVTLLRVNPGAAFVKTKVKTIGEGGSYSFKKVVLDNYQILAFADTIQHVGALPTYYKNTLLWEEADTLFVNNNRDDLNITSLFKPGPPSGRGHLSGLVQEEVVGGSGGRTKLPKPVKQVGVSARRVQNTGRGQEEVLTLIAYVFTDDHGEFSLTNLPTGNYRINIQYPGYPMDEKSFINFTIGTGLQEEVKVEALVDKGVINVRQLIITGIWSKENYKTEVFPNPTSSVINMTFETTSSYRDIGIFDITGKEIQTVPAPNEKVEINVTSFSKGIYLIKVNDKGSLVKSVHVIIE